MCRQSEITANVKRILPPSFYITRTRPARPGPARPQTYGRRWLLGGPRAKRDGPCCRLLTAVGSLGGRWQRSRFRQLGLILLFRFALSPWLIPFMTTGAKGSTFTRNLAV